MTERSWRERRRLRKLERVRRELEDALYDLEHWSFADRPSRKEDRKASIHRLIRQYEALGGDVLPVLPWRRDNLAVEAMPDVFESVRETHGNGWMAVRRVEL